MQVEAPNKEETELTKDALDHHFDACVAAVKANIQILDGFLSNFLIVSSHFLFIIQLGTDFFQVILKLESMIPFIFSRFGGSSRLFLKFFHVSLHARDSGLQEQQQHKESYVRGSSKSSKKHNLALGGYREFFS